jgi:pilus assembly protein CpaE
MSDSPHSIDLSAINAHILSVALVSPDKQCRSAVTIALGECHNGPVREFTTYPPGLDDESTMLGYNFDAVIIDLDSNHEQALHLVESLCVQSQAVVMVLSERKDPDLLLNCMHAGAREFLTLPLAPGALAEAMMRASALRSALRTPVKTDYRLLVFFGAKGGSGATTLACNFAVSLARESERRTLLIDLNLPLGDAAINLGIKAQYSIVNAFQNSSRLDANFLIGLLVRHSSGLFVLAGPNELGPTYVSSDAIDKLLEVACQNFDFVVVDAGSRLDLKCKHLLYESSTIYLVTQVGIPELRNSHRMIAQFSVEGRAKLEIVINRYDPRINDIDEEHIDKALTRPAQWKIPNDYAAVRRMQNTATPFADDDSPISRAIRQMTRSVCGQSAILEKKKIFSFFQ